MADPGDGLAIKPTSSSRGGSDGQTQSETSWPRSVNQMAWKWQQAGGSWTAQEPQALASPLQPGTAWVRHDPHPAGDLHTQGDWQDGGPQGNPTGTFNGKQNNGNSMVGK